MPEQEIRGIRLGMSAAQVRARLGRPAKVKRFSAAHEGFRILAWLYPRHGLEVELHGKSSVVGRVATRSRADRTQEGVRVGTTEQELKDKLSEAICSPSEPAFRSCFVGSDREGGRQTLFEIRGGRVREISITVVF